MKQARWQKFLLDLADHARYPAGTRRKLTWKARKILEVMGETTE